MSGSKVHPPVEPEAENTEHETPQQSPVSMNMRFNAGGLVGWPATIANMSAVGFVLVLVIMMYTDFRSSVKEEREITRDEIRRNRESNERANDAIVNALTIQSNAIQNQSSVIQPLVSEMKADRLMHERQINEVITELKKANTKKN